MDTLGVTITGMAEDLKMSRPGLSRVLNGHEDLTLTRAEKIARFLDTDLADLLSQKKSRQPA
jgi:plasmid maintenance system antidote protein VapI